LLSLEIIRGLSNVAHATDISHCSCVYFFNFSKVSIHLKKYLLQFKKGIPDSALD
jgi:hypothetical protein